MNEIRIRPEPPDLYEYLRVECPDLKAAKKWIRIWSKEWDQVLPWDTEPMFTSRAMAGHLSNVLEGNSGESGGYGGNYMATKYGSEIYNAQWGKEDEE